MAQKQTVEQEIAVVLLSISKVAKRLAARFAGTKLQEGDDKDVEYEQPSPDKQRLE